MCTLYILRYNLDNNRSGRSIVSKEKFWEIFAHKLIVFIFCSTVCHGIWHDKKLLKICYHTENRLNFCQTICWTISFRDSVIWYDSADICVCISLLPTVSPAVCSRSCLCVCGVCKNNVVHVIEMMVHLLLSSALPKFIYVGSARTILHTQTLTTEKKQQQKNVQTMNE